ncbi:MAG: tRNA (N(6)-L-threonylcarbamoyladenosine(37)-C(2))-methylthiotransferase MtaB [Candidatus Goldiibacteriota bacterium]
MKFGFLTYGCKVNQYETQRIREILEAAGGTESNEPEFYIINSCTVTDKIDRDIMRDIRRIKRTTAAKIILTGCLTKRNFEKEYADIVVPNDRKYDVSFYPLKPAEEDFLPPRIISDFYQKNRAFVKIQDGCSNFCSYCEVPFVRGSVLKSRPINEIKEEIRALTEKGFAEIILTGINIGLYGAENNYRENLPDVLKEAAAVHENGRIRLSSVGPEHLSEDIVDFFADNPEKMCPHFHISMQSGCDKILRLMRRKYTAREYKEKTEYILKKMPDAGITTDIITGFPGETDADFEETYKFTENLRLSRIHVFSYSDRPDAAASGFGGKVDEKEKKARMRKLAGLAEKKQKDFAAGNEGKIRKVLVENEEKKGVWTGYTGNYIKVKIKDAGRYVNKIIRVRISGINGKEAAGEIIRTDI